MPFPLMQGAPKARRLPMQHQSNHSRRRTIVAAVASLAVLPLVAQPVVAVYDLAFLDSNLDEAPTLQVCTQTVAESLILNAHVETTTGPAQGGAVVFQYCSYK